MTDVTWQVEFSFCHMTPQTDIRHSPGDLKTVSWTHPGTCECTSLKFHQEFRLQNLTEMILERSGMLKLPSSQRSSYKVISCGRKWFLPFILELAVHWICIYMNFIYLCQDISSNITNQHVIHLPSFNLHQY